MNYNFVCVALAILAEADQTAPAAVAAAGDKMPGSPAPRSFNCNPRGYWRWQACCFVFPDRAWRGNVSYISSEYLSTENIYRPPRTRRQYITTNFGYLGICAPPCASGVCALDYGVPQMYSGLRFSQEIAIL